MSIRLVNIFPSGPNKYYKQDIKTIQLVFLQAQLLKFLMRIVAYQRSGSIRKITTIRMLGSDHHIREVVLMMVVTTYNQ